MKNRFHLDIFNLNPSTGKVKPTSNVHIPKENKVFSEFHGSVWERWRAGTGRIPRDKDICRVLEYPDKIVPRRGHLSDL